ncbi:cupin domain-containing protein [Paenibacillus sp. FJAT-26967]|uniref:cupin domain-containing protein n=1 Tax=Paenibacillus sp. FJAT-26967 TaxID=1729690 RepID=UPI000839458E|nr:cupin domain-containing protein [Paenibacillus sp. FJAT-26967]
MRNSYQLSKLAEQMSEADKNWLEFLRVPSMSAGIYRLRAGETDGQLPHTEDELYYIAEGRAELQVSGESVPVEKGSLVYVEAHAEHRFHTITEDLTILVFFSPAEYTNKP